MAIDVKDIVVPDGSGTRARKAQADSKDLAGINDCDATSPRTDKGAGACQEAERWSKTWLYKPVIDLMIGCAGWSVPLLLLLYFTADYGVTISIVFYGLALVFNYPHYMATIYRAYHTREDLSRYRIFTIHLTLLIAAAGAITHSAAWLIPWVFTIYITWSPWHYSGQNFGLALMFARRAGIKPSVTERRALLISFLASYALVFLTMHSGTSPDPYVLSLGLPAEPCDGVRAALAFVFAVTGPWALYRFARRGGWKLIIGPATLFATQFLWFVAPFVLHLTYGIEIPQTRYSTGILAVMHSAQYLWITSYYARREALGVGAEGWRARTYFAAMIVGGIALFLPGPWLISYLFHYDFTSTMLIFTAMVNIHHFVLDGAIWKLREGRIAALLMPPARLKPSIKEAATLEGKEAENLLQSRGANGDTERRWIPASVRWIGSSKPKARAFRIAAAVLLVLVAGLDQARFFLAVAANSAAGLSRAERLNPFDGPVHTRLAKYQDGSGEVEEAVAEYRRALKLNPRDAEARTGFARLLIENQRYQDAYDEYKLMSPYIKSDPNSLVNFGILAERLGHRDEAIESWNQTLNLEPNAKNAHLYLADALYADGKTQEAVTHYEQYLAMVTTALGARLDPQDIVRIALKVGDAYTGSRDFDRALVYYHKAADIAKQTRVKGLESLALEHAGNLYAEAGDKRQAADLYKRALRLDAEGQDDNAAALDWFAYAQFLNSASQPKTVVLACTMKAESLLPVESAKELDVVRQFGETVKSGMSRGDVDKVLTERDKLVDQALEMKF